MFQKLMALLGGLYSLIKEHVANQGSRFLCQLIHRWTLVQFFKGSSPQDALETSTHDDGHLEKVIDEQPTDEQTLDSIASMPNRETILKKPALHDQNKKRNTPPSSNIPGKRDKFSGQSGSRGKNKRHIKQPSLELQCVNKARKWIVVLDLPSQDNQVEVRQGRNTLSKGNDGKYTLPNLDSNILIRSQERSETVKLFDGHSPLIFQMQKNWKGTGRKVKTVSDGYYLVLAPSSWHRINPHPPIGRELCRDDGFIAHFFRPDKGGERNFEEDGFAERGNEFFMPRQRFSLEGNEVYDDSDKGTLFCGNSPPDLADKKNWEDISWIRVGEEKGEWSENFQPGKESLVNILAQANLPGDWFYLRIYNNAKELIHSIDFRYCSALEKILVNNNPHCQEYLIIPQLGGHEETTIEFSGAVSVQPVESKHLRQEQQGSIFNVMPDADADQTTWSLGNGSACVEAEIILPRIWWRIIGATPDVTETWHDTPPPMTRKEFSQNRNANIQIRLPMNIRSVQAGFSDLNRFYPAIQSREDDKRKRVELPLRDFCDYLEIAEDHDDTSLKIRVDTNEIVLITIPANILPAPDSINSSVYHPPIKKTAAGFRRGKGFSVQEISEAGLDVISARQIGLRVDRRRRTKHGINIETLVKVKEKYHA